MINVHGFRFNVPPANPDISSSDHSDRDDGDSCFLRLFFSNVYIDGSWQSRSIRLKYRSSSRGLIKAIIENSIVNYSDAGNRDDCNFLRVGWCVIILIESESGRLKLLCHLVISPLHLRYVALRTFRQPIVELWSVSQGSKFILCYCRLPIVIFTH